MSEVSGESHATQTNQECLPLYMKYPGVHGAYCPLGCCVDQRLFIQGVATGRLAYDIGLRNGDHLRSINLTEVDKVSASSVVDCVQWLDVERPIVFGIKRRRTQQVEFWWFVFKLVIKGGYPAVNVLCSIHNSSGVPPELHYDFQQVSVFEYLPPPEKITIMQESSQLYLSVQSEKLEFLPLEPSTALFYMYRYAGPDPEDGVPIALVQTPPQTRESDSCVDTVILNGVQLALTNFPPFMTSPQPILSNSRFFYLKQKVEDYTLIESESQSGYCIAKDPKSTDAIAEKPPTDCSLMHVFSDGPAASETA